MSRLLIFATLLLLSTLLYKADSQAAEYLFVVGGGSRSTLQTTEIVSLAEGESIPECLNELADHPNDILDGSGGALPTAGYLPHVCASYYNPQNECWVYSPMDNTWTQTSTMPRDVYGGSPAYHPAWGMIMSGGFSSYDKVLITEDAQVFEELPELDYTDTQHCVAAVNENMLFTTGLGRYDDETYMYYRDTGEWVQLANLPTKRFAMGCGVVSVTGADGSEQLEAVVVGGFDDLDDRLDVVEIFNIEDGTWRSAQNPFPIVIDGMSIAQHDETFYVVGGNTDPTFPVTRLDTIYRYEAGDESWRLMPNRMKYERYGATPMMVNASMFPACN